MKRGACVRCGHVHEDWTRICPACGHRPDGDGLLTAWLLSEEHLTRDKLEAAAARIAEGEELRPSQQMLDKARRALKRRFSSDPGLTSRQRLGLVVVSVLITPLVGWACWAWWLGDRPRAAWQAFGIAAPLSVVFFVFGVALKLGFL